MACHFFKRNRSTLKLLRDNQFVKAVNRTPSIAEVFIVYLRSPTARLLSSETCAGNQLKGPSVCLLNARPNRILPKRLQGKKRNVYRVVREIGVCLSRLA